MNRFLPIVIPLALLLAAPRPISAQASGTISGTVRDNSGAVVPGAKVTATNEDTNLARTVVTTEGQYVIPILPVGAYRVRVRRRGSLPSCRPASGWQANPRCRWMP